VGLIDGEAGLKQFTHERLKDSNIIKLASKVTYEINPNDEYPKNYTGDITIYKKDGSIISANQSCLRGGKNAPLRKEEIDLKFEANLKFGNVPLKEIKELKTFIDNIFNVNSIKLIEKIKLN